MRAKKLSTRTLLYVVLAVATLAVYARVARFEFLNYDDGEYVSDNAYVQHGIDAKTLRWAFTTGSAVNWHPLTWISHMIDWTLFGSWAGGHHLMNVALHVANTLLLLLFLERATGATGRSAFAAALFALHPLHVESVAWVAERKDVLSTLFWMLTMLAYLAYTRAPSSKRYVLVAALFAAGLMAKPMLVTLPFVLLLLDVWPLGRLGRRDASFSRLALEKSPLLALSAVSSVVTYLVQQAGGAMGTILKCPFGARIENALVAYVTYILQMFWPARLSIFYPHPGLSIPTWKPVVCAIVLALVTAAVVRARKTRPYLLVGWLWYLGTLVPVIGLVQVGLQSHADRYTYVPFIGLFLIVAWGGWDLAGSFLGRRKTLGRELGFGAAAIVLPLAAVTAVQVGYWRDSITIFRHSIEAIGENDLAHVHIGLQLEMKGDTDAAIEHYRTAARLNHDTSAYYFLANALADKGAVEEAIVTYQAAIRSEPWFEPARYALGAFLLEQKRPQEAIEQLRAAAKIDPEHAETQFQWGMALTSLQQWGEAAQHFEAAIRIAPSFAKAHYNLALTMYLTGDYAGARREVGIAQGLGYQPEQRFLDMLQEKMPLGR